MKQILAAFAQHTVFANILMALIFFSGGLALKSMVRETFPEFSLDMISVSVPYPGADPEEVEEGISRKIEEAIEGLEGVKQYTTKARENIGTATIEVSKGYDVNEVLDRVRSRIDGISSFPVDAEKPIIKEILIKDVVILFHLSGDMSKRSLKEWAEGVKDEIRGNPGISQVEIFGGREYEIGIEVSEENLRKYNLTLSAVAKAIQRSNLNLAGGTIRSHGEEIRVRTMGRKYTAKELASIVVIAGSGGEIITLDRIAVIKDGFVEDPLNALIDGTDSILLIVYKTPDEDALEISEAVNDFVSKKSLQLPEGMDIKIFYDGTDILRGRINLMVKNGIIGMFIVFILLWVFMDARLSFWCGMGMPISTAGALGILWGIGGTINMISLFGFIMVLGIVVDDAIVVGEAIFVHRKQGKAPLKAAVEGVSEVGLPVVAAVITTIIAFIPLAFVGGTMGKFIAILPKVVIACLVISLLECLVLLPAHLNHLPDFNTDAITGKKGLKNRFDSFHRFTGNALELFVEKVYMPFLGKVLTWRYISLCTAISILLLAMGLMKSGIMKFEVFPEVDGFVITSTVKFPSGTPPHVTRAALDQVEAALGRVAGGTRTISGEPLVVKSLSLVGQTLSDMSEIGPNLGSVQAILLESEKRGIHSKELLVKWEKETGLIPGVESITFQGMAAGPPGAPIEIWIQGYDNNDIVNAANELMTRLRQFEGVYQIHSDFSPGKNEIRFELKPEARTLGLTVNDLARQIHAGFYGEEAVRLQRGRDDIRVKVRYTADERSRLSELKNVRIRTPRGHEVPLKSVANIAFSPGFSTITRTDGMRVVAVSAGVDTNKANANEIFAELSSNFFSYIKNKYPGIQVSVQGEKKKMRESFGSLYVGFPLAVMGIFIIIATLFSSYMQPLVIMFTVPFGIIGAILGHLLFGYDLSIMSIFGMVALTGVVVNDAIILIERINKNIADGMPFFEAIEKGGARRFRAVFFTTLSTVGGLTPMIMEKNLQAAMLIPMALSLAAGVAFATLLTLLLIPSLIVILNDLRRLVHRTRYGRWPTREEVEPAILNKSTLYE